MIPRDDVCLCGVVHKERDDENRRYNDEPDPCTRLGTADPKPTEMKFLFQ